MNITDEQLKKLLNSCEEQLCEDALVDVNSCYYKITGLSILPKLHLLSVYKSRFEMQTNGIVTSAIVGYSALMKSLSASSEEEIATFFISVEASLYILFTDQKLTHLIGILKKEKQVRIPKT